MFLERFQHLADLPRTRVPERAYGPDSLRLQRNEKPNAWPKDLLDKIYGTVPQNLLQRYPDALPFYAKLSKFLGVPAENLLVASGIDEPIRNLLTLTCEPGDAYVFTPGYAMYEVYGRMLGLKPTQIAYDPRKFMTAEEFCAKIPAQAKIVFLPNPSQPVENCFDLGGLRKIASFCRSKDILFVVDEAYYFFGAPTAIGLTTEFENVLVMRSFSKAFGAASLRLGYVIGGPAALKPLSAYRLGYEANALTFHAGGVLLDCFESHVKPSVDAICQGRDWLREAAKGAGLSAWGSVSNNVLIDLGSADRAKAAAKALEAKEIYVKAGFGAPVEGCILVTCGPKDMMTRFFDALQEVLKGKASACTS
ncbi:MAG: histidinol-phosphate aminotransferase family protein [Elusimicrobia bacterium]|nr:histidinol-phosphate aminotransferase family protein [Elusimicrobiota bacterium]